MVIHYSDCVFYDNEQIEGADDFKIIKKIKKILQDRKTRRIIVLTNK
jgi:hypothetical protein